MIGNWAASELRTLGLEITESIRPGRKPQNHSITLDLSDKEKFQSLNEYDVAIFCSGISSVSECQLNPDSARKINVDHTLRLAMELINRNCRVVFLSSNQVFSGKKPFYSLEDQPSPINNYGRFKFEVENALLGINPDKVAILRMTKVIDHQNRKLLGWQSQLKSNKEVKIYENVYISPIGLDVVGNVLLNLCLNSKTGIFQLGSNTEKTLFDYSINWANENDIDTRLITPVHNSDVFIPIHNSLRTVLPNM